MSGHAVKRSRFRLVQHGAVAQWLSAFLVPSPARHRGEKGPEGDHQLPTEPGIARWHLCDPSWMGRLLENNQRVNVQSRDCDLDAVVCFLQR